MISPTRWFDRKFEERVDVGAFPTIVERLRGTPARIEEKVHLLDESTLTAKSDGAWSIQENVGHLLDLEPLWSGRLDDLLNGERTLREADLTNRTTHEANHNQAPIERLTQAFRGLRNRFVEALDRLNADEVVREALHPRLKTPMRTLDLCRFVAEHDDHHLARMTMLAQSSR